MVSYSGSFGSTGKGLGLGCVTSGRLGGGFGSESTRDRVYGGEDCTGETSDCSGKDWLVTPSRKFLRLAQGVGQVAETSWCEGAP